MENQRETETNIAELSGDILAAPMFSHKSYGETFFEVMLGVERKSGYMDEIKVLISDRLICDFTMEIGMRIKVSGQIRTYNEEQEGRSRLNIVIFAREITKIEQDEEMQYENYIFIDGFICKRPIRRTSPLGREICDLMIAVNRMYGKSDYIPCIAWGRNATYAGSLDVGERMIVTGRLQSREYRKRDEYGNSIAKVAYEVSVLKIDG